MANARGGTVAPTSRPLRRRARVGNPNLLALFLIVILFYTGVSFFLLLGTTTGGDAAAAAAGDGNSPGNLASSTQFQADQKATSALKEDRSSKPVAIVPNLRDGTLQGKERLYEMLLARNITSVNADDWSAVPSWDEIVRRHGAGPKGGPIVLGLERCAAFRNSTDPVERRIAPAGLFATGTNLLSVLLEFNCQNPVRVAKLGFRRGHGNEWQVSWGKHTPAIFRSNFSASKTPLKYDKTSVLPVVMVRNSYGWMESMCRNPYTIKWDGQKDQAIEDCPQLKTSGENEWRNISVKYGAGIMHHTSLAHLWSDWNSYYFRDGLAAGDEGDLLPRLMIRFEDLVFRPKEVTEAVCHCAGGVLGHRPDDKDAAEGDFHYVVQSAKRKGVHPGHQNGLVDSWIRYGARDPVEGFSEGDLKAAKEALDREMMEAFAYLKPATHD